MRDGFGKGSGHGGAARCPQFAHIRGVGALDHGLDHRNRFRAGRGPPDSPGHCFLWPHGCQERSAGGPRRRQLRAYPFARRPASGYGELAARSCAPDWRVPQARSTAQERIEAAARVCDARDYSYSKSDQGRAGGRGDCHFRHSRRASGHQQPPGSSQETPASDLRYPRDDPPHCQADRPAYPGAAAEDSRNRSAQSCNLPCFRYSALSLRDGILAQMAADYDRSTRSGRAIESERWESINRAVEHYRVDLHHALQVRDSALLLFSSLKSVHQLPAEYREWLSAAAMLYEVGDYVNRNGHHRHTYYIIANSEILGYTPQQRRIIGSIARYLGKSRPTAGDGAMSALSPEEQENVEKASLLLRIARTLNMGRSQSVGKVAVSARSGRVAMKLTPRGKASVDLEVWSIEKDRSYFREVFGRELSVAAA